MIKVLLIGSLAVVVTVVIESFVIAVAVAALNRFAERLRKMTMFKRTMLTLSGLSLWLLAGISVALWMWALLFLGLGEFDTLASALYFSSVSATTLGYGDTLLSERWQLLSGFVAANGLVLFSLNTAFLFEALRRLNEAGRREA